LTSTSLTEISIASRHGSQTVSRTFSKKSPGSIDGLYESHYSVMVCGNCLKIRLVTATRSRIVCVGIEKDVYLLFVIFDNDRGVPAILDTHDNFVLRNGHSWFSGILLPGMFPLVAGKLSGHNKKWYSNIGTDELFPGNLILWLDWR
jgi:hypothetical protein